MPKDPPKRISQTQIANELGYSQALVSMALNGRKKGISATAYDRIWKYALEHGYSPRGMVINTDNSAAREATVGYVLRSPLKLANKSNFFSHIHQGLYDHLNARQIKTVFLGSEDDLDWEDPASRAIPESVRGIAVMGELREGNLAKLSKAGRPIVYISARATGLCHSVLSNESEAAALLVDHLRELGHRSFAWLGGNQYMGRFRDRYEGVRQALQRHGLSLENRFATSHQDADRKEGYLSAQSILKASRNQPPPTAWICLNGLMARGAINFLFQQGYRVGSDISVTAFDATNVCVEENPTITAAGANPEEMGAEAARILLGAIDGSLSALTDLTLPAKLAVRESTGTPHERAAPNIR